MLTFYNDHTDTVHSLLCNYNNPKFIKSGDFNLPAIKWSLFNDVFVSHNYGNTEKISIS